MADDADPTLDPRQANFRRRAAMLAILFQVALAGALLVRHDDIPPNTSSLVSWIIAGNVITIAVGIGAKSLEQFLIAWKGPR